MEYSPLIVQNLSVRYNYTPIITDISFSIPRGKNIAIVGPNGAGKSTLLKGILDLVPISSGNTLFFGESLEKKRLSVAYVPQREESDWDFPIKVLDVVLMGRHGQLRFWQRPGKNDISIAKEALAQVDMLKFKDRQINQLSGGQQQRVFLARALAQKASLYLMDEPFAGVDATTEKAIIDLFNNLKRQNKTIVCVHHDLNTIGDYFDWIILINARLIASGPIEKTLTTENLKKTFGGRLSLLSKMTEEIYRKNLDKVHDD